MTLATIPKLPEGSRWTLLERDASRRWKCQCACGRIASVDRTNLQSGRSMSCNQGACRTPSRPQSAERFWAHVDKDSAAPCWLWRGAVGVKGYGTMSWFGRTYSTHRVAAWLAGMLEDPYDSRGVGGILISHECDQKLCCNPAHLRRTTNAQNTKEAWQRIRSSRTK